MVWALYHGSGIYGGDVFYILWKAQSKTFICTIKRSQDHNMFQCLDILQINKRGENNQDRMYKQEDNHSLSWNDSTHHGWLFQAQSRSRNVFKYHYVTSDASLILHKMQKNSNERVGENVLLYWLWLWCILMNLVCRVTCFCYNYSEYI